MDQHKGGKWLIHGTKHCKDKQSGTPLYNILVESKHDIKESQGNMFNTIFQEKVGPGQKHPGRCIVAEPKLPSFRKPKCVDQNE